ncbi:MAG: inositol monophosphatase family protein [Acidimicrobiales bacterium]
MAAAIVGLADDGPVAVGADGAPTEAADPRAEDAAVAELAGLGLPIVSEEAGPVGGRRPMSGEAWIALDPLDGSRNFRAGLPPFATAMGLVGGDGRPRAGLVAELTTGRRWWAATGGGAWVDGRPARPRPVPILLCPCPAPGDALPSAPGYDRVRVSGSTTSDLCRVADGSAGAFVDLTRGVVHVHDLAGPLAVLAEAGAAVVSAEPEPLLVADPGRRMRLVAAWSAAEAQSLQLQCRTV